MDWITALGLVVAVITLFMNDDLHNLLQPVAAMALRIINLRIASCASATWNDLPDETVLHNCIAPCTMCSYPGLRSICRGNTFLPSFVAFLSTQQTRFNKPDSLDLLQQYFRTDARTLFWCFMASITQRNSRMWTYWAEGNYIEFRCRMSYLKLKENGKVYEGEMATAGQPLPYPRHRRTKLQYEQIFIHHYPPWFTETVTNTAKVTFVFPSLRSANIERSGWILATGLGDIMAPTPFFSMGLGDFLEKDGHRGRWGNGTNMESCRHFQTTIEDRIVGRFPEDKVVQAAVKAIEGMRRDHSASGVWQLLDALLSSVPTLLVH